MKSLAFPFREDDEKSPQGAGGSQDGVGLAGGSCVPVLVPSLTVRRCPDSCWRGFVHTGNKPVIPIPEILPRTQISRRN